MASSTSTRSLRPSGPRLRAWLTAEGRALVLGAGAVASVPVVVSAVRAIQEHWAPLGDRAEMVARGYDVFSSHPPLLGPYSASSGVLGQTTYNLGPLLHWFLAIPAHIGGYAPPLWVAATNIACVVISLALARRRGGTGFMLGTAVVILVMTASLVSLTYSDVWNPSPALLPLMLLVFMAWSLACGEVRWLPLIVVVASFISDCHLTYVIPAVSVVAIGVGGLLLVHRHAPVLGLRRWALIALAVFAICWVAPVAEEVIHRPGNFVLVARSVQHRERPFGASGGWHALALTAGVPPWWLQHPRSPLQRLIDVLHPVGTGTAVSAVIVLLGLAAAGVVALRRRRREVAIACLIALALCVGVALVAAGTPTTGLLFLSIGYTVWWASIAGMFAWLVLGWSIVTLTGLGARLALVPRPAQVAVAVLALGGAVAVSLSPGRGENIERPLYRPMHSIADQLERLIPPGRVVAVERRAGNPFDSRFELAGGVVWTLREHGAQPLAGAMEAGFGSRYAPRGRRPAAAVHIECRIGPGRVLARIPQPGPCPIVVTITGAVRG